MARDNTGPSSSLVRLAFVNRKNVVGSWDFWLSAVLAVLAGVFARPKPAMLFDVAAVEVAVASALVGVILAGLAIMTAFLDEGYVAVLLKSGTGVMPEVFQFRLTAAAAVSSVVVNVGLIMFREAPWLSGYRSPALAASVWLFTYTLFATLNLVALVGGHLALREKQVEITLEGQGRPKPTHEVDGRAK